VKLFLLRFHLPQMIIPLFLLWVYYFLFPHELQLVLFLKLLLGVFSQDVLYLNHPFLVLPLFQLHSYLLFMAQKIHQVVMIQLLFFLLGVLIFLLHHPKLPPKYSIHYTLIFSSACSVVCIIISSSLTDYLSGML